MLEIMSVAGGFADKVVCYLQPFCQCGEGVSLSLGVRQPAFPVSHLDRDGNCPLIATAKPISAGNIQIINIILEKAEAYFQGQKSVDEVAEIIQGRMKMYVSERY